MSDQHDTQMMRNEDPELYLGHGHSFIAIVDHTENLVGWLHNHPDARSSTHALCQSFCAVRPGFGPDVHEVLKADPLTLSPSLKCRICGSHGRVRDGRWEPI